MGDWCMGRRCGEMRKEVDVEEGRSLVVGGGEEFGVGGGEEPIGSCGATAHLLWLPLLHPSIYRHSHWNTSLPHKLCPHSEGQFRQQLPSLGVQSNCHEKHLICESLHWESQSVMATTMMGETRQVCYFAPGDWPRVMPSLYLVTSSPYIRTIMTKPIL